MKKFGRYGRYGGKLCFFTHRNPANGAVWTDDIMMIDWRGKEVPGRWINAERVKWLD